MNIREVSVSRLREYENNPRNNDLAVEKVKYSIERFGFLPVYRAILQHDLLRDAPAERNRRLDGTC